MHRILGHPALRLVFLRSPDDAQAVLQWSAVRSYPGKTPKGLSVPLQVRQLGTDGELA